MAVKRNLSPAGQSGAQFGTDVADSGNAAFGLNGGLLQSVAGTNAITATLSHPTGFAAYPAGFRCTLIPAATNTDVVTLNIASVGAMSVRDQDGAALTAGKLVAGRAQPLIVDGSTFRFDGSAKPDTTVVTARVLSRVKIFLSGSGTWNVPASLRDATKNFLRVTVLGGGGSGSWSFSVNTEGTGGGAGGTCLWEGELAAGVVLSYAVGAGGASVSAANQSGNAGSASSLSGAGMGSLTANGGGAGQHQPSGAGAAGAPGGSASGGQVNITGQASPTATTNNINTCGACASLKDTLAALANNTTVGVDFWGLIAPQRVIGALDAGTPIKGGNAAVNTTAPYGCGSGSLRSAFSGAGGGGLIVIEYEA